MIFWILWSFLSFALLSRNHDPFVIFGFLLLHLGLLFDFVLFGVSSFRIFLGLDFVLFVFDFMLSFMNCWLDFMSMFNFMSGISFNFSGFFISSCSFRFILNFRNHLMLYRLGVFRCFMFNWFMLNFMLHFRLLLMLYYFMFSLFLNFMLNRFMLCFMLNYFMFHFVLSWLVFNWFVFSWFVFNWFVFNWFVFNWFMFSFGIMFLSFFMSFLLFGLRFRISLRSLFELFGNIAYSSPIFSQFFLLSTHFDKKSSGQNFFIKGSSDEIDSINFALKNNFKWARVVLLNFDEVELRECFFYIFLHSLEIAFDKVEWDMLDLIT